MERLDNMNISGNGQMSGGKYKNVKISGTGVINGDLESSTILVSGSGDFFGNVNSREIRVSGSCNYRKDMKANFLKVSGNLNCYGAVHLEESMKVSGSGKIHGNVYGKDIRISGNIDIKKEVSFNTMNASGAINIEGNCEGNDFKSKGKVNINGLLSADKIEILLHRQSFIREIGGEEIIIKNYHSKTFWPISITFGGERKVKSNLIEGDRIRLNSTECALVRGENIIIEEGCKIDCIEYTKSLEIDDNSKVLKVIKVENKEGLDLEKY
ncbi:MAG: polymer-forming cytoskeletal protein [Clostridium perfringens]|nr:polymer-forming cytoskeletal protein [Clostridium perfringens]